MNEWLQQQSLWECLRSYGSHLAFHRQTIIYTPEQNAQFLYLLISGQVSLQLISLAGRALTLRVVEGGQIFGHSVLTRDATYDTYAEVIQPARVIAVPRQGLLQALADSPAIGTQLLDTLSHYRQTVSNRLEEVTFKSVPARLASLLLEMSEMMGYTSEHEPSRLPRRTHQQLAEMTNTYRETVTKVINQFRAARLLDIDRTGITLLNPSGLRELAQG
jgi:CRP-like cAMP-binding protein